MHRFHLPELPLASGPCSLTGDEATHAIRVLRLHCGEQVGLLNGKGATATANVSGISRHTVALEVVDVHHTPSPPCPMTLFQAITKPRSMELIVQKATELGVSLIQPVLSERVVSRLDADDALRKAEKWQRIAIEAMKQSGLAWLPEVRPAGPFDQIAPVRAANAQWFFGSLRKDAPWLRDYTETWTTSSPGEVGLWIGPEGDFSEEELALLEQHGAKPFTLGSTVLRSETAALCGLTVLGYELALAGR
jgi:16S rRNA (uracil1498-N3)-methyltransferase